MDFVGVIKWPFLSKKKNEIPNMNNQNSNEIRLEMSKTLISTINIDLMYKIKFNKIYVFCCCWYCRDAIHTTRFISTWYRI